MSRNFYIIEKKSDMYLKLLCFLWLSLVSTLCFSQDRAVRVGAACTKEYFPLLKGKKIAVFSNHTGMVGNEHTVDLLKRSGFDVVVIFSPEHGFRGTADAGEHVAESIDPKTGIPIRSLYDGRNGKPKTETMHTFDCLVVDIQDVGVRFYTYYISMVKLMDACAEHGKKMLILDRPNPNGHYVDGPILDMKYKSGVGWLPIPVVHGLTLGELARMVNGEKWLSQGRVCDLTVIPCKNYTHQTLYRLPIPPSPNLPNMKAVYLYPSLCFFEATPVSLGRGTSLPFQIYGHPNMLGYSFSFTPHSVTGAKNPPQLERECYGIDLSQLTEEEILAKGIDLSYLIDAYRNLHLDDFFFNSFFEKLMGAGYVRKMIASGKSADEIKAHWQPDILRFKQQREPYLLYPE